MRAFEGGGERSAPRHCLQGRIVLTFLLPPPPPLPFIYRHHAPPPATWRQLIDKMLTADRLFTIALPRLPARLTLERSGQLEPRVSVLDEEFDEAALEVRGQGVGVWCCAEVLGGCRCGGGGYRVCMGSVIKPLSRRVPCPWGNGWRLTGDSRPRRAAVAGGAAGAG